ncbi:MAG TPA: DUF3810 domain-containing protein [Firmicutes bacterium]|nr:DUF3810 domain-containing protein [Bacillota bacterium]
MKKKAARKKSAVSILVYILIGLGLILSFAAPSLPVLIEAGYSTSLYKWISGPISRFTGLFPFSVAEFIIVGLGLFCLFIIIRGAITLFKKPKEFFRSILKGGAKLVIVLVLLYVGFNMLWGLNYSRLSFADISGLPVEPAAVEELTALALSLTSRANVLRAQVAEDERGVMTLDSSIRQMFSRAETGYDRAAAIYPELGGKFGPPKGVFLSHYWSYTGISGMYFPFTAEANVNIDIPHLLLPATAAHEMAHQRGFAREDEANFLGYLACTLHPDADFQYSGTVSALLNTMNALYRADIESYKAVRKEYCDGLNRDLKDWREYWAQFEGPVERVSSNVNDSYLKANRQQDGVQSYGRMVDLLLAEFRKAQGEP